jgi:hypothetical protein
VFPSIGTFIFLNLETQRRYEINLKNSVVEPLFSAFFIGLCLFLLDRFVPFVYVLSPFLPTIFVAILLKKKWTTLSWSKKKLAAILSLIIIIPYFTLFLGMYSTVSSINLYNDEEKIIAVSYYISNLTTSFWGLEGFEKFYISFHRASTDFLKFLLIGAGSCGEMAYSTKAIFDIFNLKSHVISLAGEDHMFVEVFHDGTWLVVDPGYELNLITREKRAVERLQDIGGLSYVVTYTQDGPIALTKYYVQTDKIIIRVTENGIPQFNSKVTLEHMFNGDSKPLPAFHTNMEGFVELELGPMNYNNSDIPAESFYRVLVNGKNSNEVANSTGSGKSHLIEIEISNID